MSGYTNISFRPSQFLENKLSKKADKPYGSQCQKDLSRYYQLIDQTIQKINLSINEACLICDALNGVMFEFQFKIEQCFLIEIKDSIDLNNLDQKWEVNKKELISKLENFNGLQAATVIDAVEQFWNCKDQDIKSNVANIFNIN